MIFSEVKMFKLVSSENVDSKIESISIWFYELDSYFIFSFHSSVSAKKVADVTELQIGVKVDPLISVSLL